MENTVYGINSVDRSQEGLYDIGRIRFLTDSVKGSAFGRRVCERLRRENGRATKRLFSSATANFTASATINDFLSHHILRSPKRTVTE